MNVSPDIWVWVSALLTLAILSYLYKDNPVYKFAEYFFVGIASGYFMSIQYDNVLIPNVFQPVWGSLTSAVQGDFTTDLFRIGALILGIMMFSRFVSSLSWLSRWPMGVMVGTFSGLAVIGAAQGDLIEQIRSNLLPLVADGAIESVGQAQGVAGTGLALLSVTTNFILIFGLLTCLYYFFFSTEHKGVSGGIAKAGIYLLMISFGASYGFTVMARITLALDRLRFLYETWLGLPVVQ